MELISYIMWGILSLALIFAVWYIVKEWRITHSIKKDFQQEKKKEAEMIEIIQQFRTRA